MQEISWFSCFMRQSSCDGWLHCCKREDAAKFEGRRERERECVCVCAYLYACVRVRCIRGVQTGYLVVYESVNFAGIGDSVECVLAWKCFLDEWGPCPRGKRMEYDFCQMTPSKPRCVSAKKQFERESDRRPKSREAVSLSDIFRLRHMNWNFKKQLTFLSHCHVRKILCSKIDRCIYGVSGVENRFITWSRPYFNWWAVNIARDSVSHPRNSRTHQEMDRRWIWHVTTLALNLPRTKIGTGLLKHISNFWNHSTYICFDGFSRDKRMVQIGSLTCFWFCCRKKTASQCSSKSHFVLINLLPLLLFLRCWSIKRRVQGRLTNPAVQRGADVKCTAKERHGGHTRQLRKSNCDRTRGPVCSVIFGISDSTIVAWRLVNCFHFVSCGCFWSWITHPFLTFPPTWKTCK